MESVAQMAQLSSRMTWALRHVQAVMGVVVIKPKVESDIKSLVFCKYPNCMTPHIIPELCKVLPSFCCVYSDKNVRVLKLTPE